MGNTNLASEFFVASCLFRLGCTVTVTMGNTKEIDLIVVNPKGSVITIDVKGLKNTTNWPLSLKRVEKNHYYVLVTYKNKYSDPSFVPEIFVVPSLEIKKIMGSWSGNKNVTAVGYKHVRSSKYKSAWHYILKK